jgi:hypothetical protein
MQPTNDLQDLYGDQPEAERQCSLVLHLEESFYSVSIQTANYRLQIEQTCPSLDFTRLIQSLLSGSVESLTLTVSRDTLPNILTLRLSSSTA